MKETSIFIFFCLILIVSAGLISQTALAQQKKDEGSGKAAAAISAAVPGTPVAPATPEHRRLFLIGYVNSDISDPNRSATVVSLTNQSNASCEVSVDWFKGLDPANAACTTVMTINPGETHEHCSRELPGAVAECQATCDSNLSFDEGKAIVNIHKACFKTDALAVDARLYHTTGDVDEAIAAIADLKVIRFGTGNRGD